MKKEIRHYPVLYRETFEFLYWKREGSYVDATAGTGGHLRYFLENSHPESFFIGFEIDPELAENLKNLSAEYPHRVIIINNSSTYIDNYLDYFGIKHVEGVLIDGGLSGYHVETPERGFSYRYDAFLDMRYSPYYSRTAADILNQYSFHELVDVFWKWGDIEYADKIARAIIENRSISKITTTFHLVSIFYEVIEKYRMYWLKRKVHKELSRIFQSLRIEVNNEIENLKKLLRAALHRLSGGGRIAVITYHSVEDRVVKEFIKEITGMSNEFKVYGPISPSIAELKENRRSRSAKMRGIIKVKR